MTYKTLLVHLDDAPACKARVDFAFSLAARFDAHLVGLYALESARIPSYALAEAGPLVREIEARRRTETARSMEAAFHEAERRAGRTGEWRLAIGDALPALLESACYADLLITGQPEPGDGPRRALVGEMLLGAGRPVLFLPYAGRFERIGKRIQVAWNGSREAARAVADALPFLSSAHEVDVVAFDDGGDASPSWDGALYLSRHGVKAKASRQKAVGIDVAAQMLSRAADHESDLIVMGAYGHSRLREAAFGGATRGILDAMTVPVLMAH